MARLYELASVFRSKNAGPFLITVDLMFEDPDVYRRVRDSGTITTQEVCRRYGLAEEDTNIWMLEAARAIKITMRRKGPASGGPGDRDVYGAQQHGPLIDLEIPD